MPPSVSVRTCLSLRRVCVDVFIRERIRVWPRNILGLILYSRENSMPLHDTWVLALDGFSFFLLSWACKV